MMRSRLPTRLTITAPTAVIDGRADAAVGMNRVSGVDRPPALCGVGRAPDVDATPSPATPIPAAIITSGTSRQRHRPRSAPVTSSAVRDRWQSRPSRTPFVLLSCFMNKLRGPSIRLALSPDNVCVARASDLLDVTRARLPSVRSKFFQISVAPTRRLDHCHSCARIRLRAAHNVGSAQRRYHHV